MFNVGFDKIHYEDFTNLRYIFLPLLLFNFWYELTI